MAEWEEKNFGECAEFQEGYVNPPQGKAHFFGGHIKWLRAVDLNDGFVFDTSRKLTKAGFDSAGRSAKCFEPDTLAISKSGTIGRVGIIRDYMCGNRAIINIRPKQEQCLTRFAFYALLLGRRQIETLAEGSVQKNLYVSSLSKFAFRCPPVAEQQKIVDVLSSLDEKIELNRRTNETLEAMAQAIFKDWFVDFGPVRRKTEGEIDPVAVLGGLLPNPEKAAPIADLFPDTFGDNGVPEGWVLGALADIAIQHKRVLTPSNEPDISFAHYSLPAFDKSQSPTIDFGRDIRSNKTVIPNGAVLLSKLNPDIPRTWLVDDSPQRDKISSTEFLVFTPRATVCRNYLYTLFKSRPFRDLMVGMVTGTSKSHQRVSPPALLKSETLTPTHEISAAFQTIVDPVLTLTHSNKRQIQALEKTRDLLLPKLMSGAIRLQDVEDDTKGSD